VYKGIYEGWYCPRCADFKSRNEILEGNSVPDPRDPATRETEENWFFRLSTSQEPLERLYAEQPDFVMPQRHYTRRARSSPRGCRTCPCPVRTSAGGVTVPWE